MSYTVSKIYDSDKRSSDLVEKLLHKENIRKDDNLDYTCAIFNDNMEIIATGSCYLNTLRCMAVDSSYQGEGLMNLIITHLLEIQAERENFHVYIYTKIESAKFFKDLGFNEIVTIDNQLVFMETQKNGFSKYLDNLKLSAKEKPKVSALVMNANPFTLGHQYLVETASLESDIVHLFIVSEDVSLFPYKIRKQLIMNGTSHLNNIIYHDTGSYIISNSTFPSYFQKDKEDVILSQTLLDATIFSKIAKALNITHRYVGEEPTSVVTNLYNQTMSKVLKEENIEVVIIPRKEINGDVISASKVRKAIQENDTNFLISTLPKSSLDYILSEDAKPVIEKIQKSSDIIHY